MTHAYHDPKELLTYAPGLRALATRLVGSRDAEDLLQETWLKALRRPPARDCPPGPWLVRVLTNCARTAGRVQLRRRSDEWLAAKDAPGDQSVPTPETINSELEAAELLMRAVGDLPETRRTIVSMRFFRGQSSHEIGKRLELPPATVRWHLQRALAQLKSDLETEGRDVSGGWVAALAPLTRLPDIGLESAATAVESRASVPVRTGASQVAAAALVALAATAAVVAVWPPSPPALPPGLTQRTAPVLSALPLEGRLMKDQSRSATRQAALGETAGHGSQHRIAQHGAQSAEPARVTSDAPSKHTMRIAARLVDGNGLPVAGGELALEGEDSAFAVTDSNGDCELELTGPATGPGSPLQRLRSAAFLTATAEGLNARTIPTHAFVGADVLLGELALGALRTLTGVASAPKTLQLSSGGDAFPLALKVLGPDGYAVPNAIVELRDSLQRCEYFRADERGEISRSVAGEHWRSVSAWDPEGRFAKAKLDGASFDGSQQQLHLKAARLLHVEVYGHDGDRLPSFNWSLLEGGGSPFTLPRMGYAGETAPCTIAVGPLDATRPVHGRLLIEVDGYAPTDVPFHREASSDAAIVVRINDAEALTGVVSHRGRAVPNARIHVVKAADPFGLLIAAQKADAAGGGRVTSTDVDGHFSLPCPAGGPYTLCVVAQGFAPFLHHSVGFGKPTALEAIELERGGTLAGTLERSAAMRFIRRTASVFELYIEAVHEDGERRSASIDLRQRYVLQGLKAGEWTVRVWKKGRNGAAPTTVCEPKSVNTQAGRMSAVTHQVASR